MCQPTLTFGDANAGNATAAKFHEARPRGPHKLAKMAFMPIWVLCAGIYISGTFWFGIVGMTWVSMVNYVLDHVSSGKFERFMIEWLNPVGGKPSLAIGKFWSEKLLNRPVEHYVHMASLGSITFGNFFTWASILYMRANDVGGTMLPLLVHLYWMGFFFISGVNEFHYMAHYQIAKSKKNHIFKYEWMNWFVIYVLEPMHGFVPGFWLDHHVKIHHKESNGPNDIQGVSFFERSFYNYICFVADIPLQWFVRGPLVHYRNGDKNVAMQSALNGICFLGFGAMLTKWDTLAGVLLFWIPHITRSMIFNSSNEFVQHALVDGRDGKPHDPANNAYILLKMIPRYNYPRGLRSLPDNYEERWHAVHHAFPLKGMSGLESIAPKVKCNLVFDTDFISFKQALMLRNTKKLAEWWRPGYNFGNDNYKVSKYAKHDQKLSLEEKAKLLDTFYYPAYDLDDMGDWIYAPSFPFNMMELGPMQKHVKVE